MLARLETLGVAGYGFLVVALVASATGGFPPSTWGWCAVLTFWLAAIVLVVRVRIDLGVRDLVFAGGLGAFASWVALSSLWTASTTSTMHEVQRNLAYLGVVAAGLVIARRSTAPALVGGVFSGIGLIALYSLGTRVLPDRLGAFDSTTYGYRLAAPITYWNALGIFAVLGILLGLGFALRSRTLLARAGAGAALPLLTVTMYFTFSRGAWVALGIGLTTALAVDQRRLQLVAGGLAFLPICGAALIAADDRAGLTTLGATLEQATASGHSLVLPLVALALASSGIAVGFALLDRHVDVPSQVRRAFAVAVVALALVGVATVWTRYGSPPQLTERAWNSFKGPPKGTRTGGDVSQRLLSLSSNGRIDFWTTSWETFRREPIHGNGAGTFWQLWAAEPERPGNTTEGHSLYAETLGELGMVGLGVLVLALGAPFAAVRRARRAPLGAFAIAAYVGWLAHAGVDWDWELVGVSSAALLCGVGVIALGRPDDAGRRVGSVPRAVAVTVCVLGGALALPQLLADNAIDQGWGALPTAGRQALEDADRAGSWAPWSAEPDELRGDAWRSLGNLSRARAAYRAALESEPSDWRLWAKLADVSDGSGKTTALRRAHALNPKVQVTGSS
jgi:hypothetical protein